MRFRNSLPRRALWVTVAGLALATVWSCDSRTTAPREPAPIDLAGPLFSVTTASQVEEQAIELENAASTDSIVKTFGMSWSVPAVVKTTVSGEVYEKWTIATNPSAVGQVRDTIQAEGRYYNGNCFASFELQWGQSFVGYCNSPPPAGGVKWMRVSGSGKLTWNRKGDKTCGAAGVVCYRYDGRFTMRVERPAATLTLTQDRHVITKGTLVKFTATVTPDGFGGPPLGKIPTPFKILRWEYRPDRANAADTAWRWVCSTTADLNPQKCDYPVDSTGTLRIRVEVQGQLVVQTARVRVICVTTGDRVLDSLPVLDAIDSALALGNGLNPNPSLRREVGWRVLCDPGGPCETRFYVGSTPCRTQLPSLSASDSARMVAEGHTHVTRSITDPAGYDSLPSAVCPEEREPSPWLYFVEPTAEGGWESHDALGLLNPARTWNHYISTPWRLYRYPPPAGFSTLMNFFLAIQPYERVDGLGCSRY